VRQGTVNQRLVEQVQQRLAAARGLQFLRPVPVRALPPEGIAAAVSDEIARDVSPEDQRRTDRVYAQLGLVPADTQLAPAMQRLFTTQLAAFYDPRTGMLAIATHTIAPKESGPRLFAALTGRDLVGELVVAHELTHALQDQHWGLPRDTEPILSTHTDRLLARRALLEGDATWASFATVGGRLDDDTRARVLRQLDALPAQLAASVPDVPELLRGTLAFQYRDGTRFVDQLLAQGGWPAVDRAQADPPVSSEQVLHPERYLAAARDAPTAIELGGTAALTRAGFRPVMADTLGEAVVRLLLRRAVPDEHAAAVADGWDGDRLATFARGDELVVVWLTAWDTERDAVEFAEAMPPVAPGASIERRGKRVLVLLGPRPPGLAAGIWAGSSITTERAGERDGRSDQRSR